MSGELELEHFRRLLLHKREELLTLAETGQQASATVDLDQSKVGRLSRMDAMQAQAMSQEAGRRREDELQRIASALERIESSDYGYCLACGEEIDARRLEFEPAVTLCIQCAEKREL